MFEQEFIKRETTEFNDEISMKQVESILKEMSRDCIEDVSGELKLTVLFGSVINAKLTKTQEIV